MLLRLSSIGFLLGLLITPWAVLAQDAPTDIQTKIDARSADIKALEKEIAGYESQIAELGTKASSLSETLRSLDLTQKKLQADIALTEDKIGSKNLEIRQLDTKIGGTLDDISDDKRYVTESFKLMNETGDIPFIKLIIGGISISSIWDHVNGLATLQDDLQGRIRDLAKTKNKLETSKRSTLQAKAELVRLQEQLSDQRKVVLATRDEQNKLLRDTKSSEASYQRLVKDKLALKDAFESELLQFESDLKLAVDISKLPKTGTGVLSWPVDKVFITQYFGNTPFATANAQLYSGAGHNGIDFRASIGTPIKAALAGNVAGMGNTDIIPGCYSLGKWVLIKHSNGLSTLYAHLSLQTAAVGSTVSAGDVIGYSGNTGYTTGPHLHFGVYATSGIEIRQFTNSLHCKNAVLPIATLKAYLNPLSYLPASPN